MSDAGRDTERAMAEADEANGEGRAPARDEEAAPSEGANDAERRYGEDESPS